MLAGTQDLEDPLALHLLLKPFQGLLQGFVVTYEDFSHGRVLYNSLADLQLSKSRRVDSFLNLQYSNLPVSFQNTLPYYLEAFLRLIYPSLCALCENLLEIQEKGLCAPCQTGLAKFKLGPSEEKIRLSLRHADEGWSLFRYEEGVKEILHKIKFERRRDLLALFATDLADFLKRRAPLKDYDFLVPVPLDPQRRLEREFNQSGLLAAQLRKFADLALKKGVLYKKRSTPAQSLLGRESRLLNLEKTFEVRKKRLLRGKSILLIDDIFTTGATLEEAAKTLKNAGAAKVGFLALARAFPK